MTTTTLARPRVAAINPAIPALLCVEAILVAGRLLSDGSAHAPFWSNWNELAAFAYVYIIGWLFFATNTHPGFKLIMLAYFGGAGSYPNTDPEWLVHISFLLWPAFAGYFTARHHYNPDAEAHRDTLSLALMCALVYALFASGGDMQVAGHLMFAHLSYGIIGWGVGAISGAFIGMHPWRSWGLKRLITRLWDNAR